MKALKLKDAQLLWQGNLPNRASKIKRLLARHDIHLPGQVLSYTSVIRVNAVIPLCTSNIKKHEKTPTLYKTVI